MNMRTVCIASVLFAAVLVFTGVNAGCLKGCFEETEALLDKLPTTTTALEQMEAGELRNVGKQLELILVRWKKHTLYFSLTMEHTAYRDFLNAFLLGQLYFEAGEYPAFLAQLGASREIIEHLRQDESIGIGTLL